MTTRTASNIHGLVRRVVVSKPRDYEIYTRWTNGERQVDLARAYSLSPERVRQIIGKCGRYYNGAMGRSFLPLVDHMNNDRPSLFHLQDRLGVPKVMMCSVVVIPDGYLSDNRLHRQLRDEFDAGSFSGPLRMNPIARQAVEYLQSILE